MGGLSMVASARKTDSILPVLFGGQKLLQPW